MLLVACESGGEEVREIAPSAEPGPKLPRHLVIVSIDTLRADHLGCYGHPFVRSPNLDRVAGEGLRFTQCLSAASTTLASHTSLLSGRWPQDHGVPRNGFVVPDEALMLAERLAAQGFSTAAFLGAAPLDRSVHFDQGFDVFDAEFTTEREGMAYERRADAVTDAVLRHLDGGDCDLADRQFLFVHYFDVHSPYVAPEPYGSLYLEQASQEPPRADLESRHARLVAEKAIPGFLLPERQQAFARQLERNPLVAFQQARIVDAQYGGEISYTDHEFGRLLDGLQSRGLLDDALLVITADHGETMDEHLCAVFSHGQSVYDTEVHVPLLVRFPDGRLAGTVVDRLTSSLDVVPSVLQALGLAGDATLPGEVFPVLRDADAPERAFVFSEATKPHVEVLALGDPWPNTQNFQCVRDQRYKYMERQLDSQVRLFDLATDPGECVDRSRDPAYLAIVERMAAALAAHRAAAPAMHTSLADSTHLANALEALGYVEEAAAAREKRERDRDREVPR